MSDASFKPAVLFPFTCLSWLSRCCIYNLTQGAWHHLLQSCLVMIECNTDNDTNTVATHKLVTSTSWAHSNLVPVGFVVVFRTVCWDKCQQRTSAPPKFTWVRRRKHSKTGAFLLHLQVAQTPKNLKFVKLLQEEQSSFWPSQKNLAH